MTGWCVEYWKIDKKPEGSHAQMSEQLKYVKPEQEDITDAILITIHPQHVLQIHYLILVIISLKS